MKSEITLEYKRLMIRTRFLGVAASLGLMFLVLVEVDEVRANWTMAFSPMDVTLAVTTFSIGLVLLVRIFALVKGRIWPYSFQTGTWIVVLILLAVFAILWMYATSPIPDLPCDEQPDKVCFSIYVLYRQSPLAIAVFYFLVLSAMRSLVTLAVAKAFLSKRLK